MKKEISELIAISQFYGKQKDYTLGGGGNTSYKDNDHLYIKASGHSLATITENGFAILNRTKLKGMLHKKYSEKPQVREYEVKEDLMASCVDRTINLRPSVETLLHDCIKFSFVVHTHPHMLNGLLCSKKAETGIKDMFGDKVLFVPYTDPGMVLFKIVLKYLTEYRKFYSSDPNYIFLQNHGVFVAANSISEVKTLYENIENQLLRIINNKVEVIKTSPPSNTQNILKILKFFLSDKKYKAIRFNTLIEFFTKDLPSIKRISKPFIPDQIVYCKANPLIIPINSGNDLKHMDLEKLFLDYKALHGYDPNVIVLENGPIIGIEENQKSADLVLDIFEDAMKISFYSNYFGGPNFMTEEQITFIENWEVENYRLKVSKD